ncbi:uncharacterized protein LOC119098884 [Pollicipes pollicipes]|uniref:uncharacterized protein LOC119098884 n=1 Tax=Pollicipes pollicipes TaxID=41117 RepID=UPI0018850D87|nr:uncharacterized protein LOC119098884 [Pollicipes pollicipes]
MSGGLWDESEPSGPPENTGSVNPANGKMNDMVNDHSSPSACQYVGKNLAPDYNGVIQATTGTFTADLGLFYAVTSVMLILQDELGEDIEVTVSSTREPGPPGTEQRCTVVPSRYQYPDVARQYSCEAARVGRFVRVRRAITPLTLAGLKVMGSWATHAAVLSPEL